MNKHLIAPIASAVALIGFFLPWMSCNDITFTGMDLATGSGSSMGDMGTGDSSGATPLLFAIPLAALLIIGMYFFFKKNARLTSAMVPTIFIAAVALFVMVLKYIDLQDLRSGMSEGINELGSTSQSSSPPELSVMMEDMIRTKWGFWLTGAAFLVTILGATQYRNRSNTTTGTTEAVTPPGEVVPSSPPPDTSMTQDKGMT